jgi:hypothetical protein
MGGADASAARYIHTRLCAITRTIFHHTDDALLRYLDDDGFSIEPEHYVPIIPMVLINGASGIGETQNKNNKENQSINQTNIDQNNKQTNKQTINQSIKQTNKRTIDQTDIQTIDRSINQTIAIVYKH